MNRTRPEPTRRKSVLWTALLLWIVLMPLASAQDAAQSPGIDAILENIKNAAGAVQDASFTLTGKLVDPDGTEIWLDVEMQLIPDERLASAYIIQPDALADNQILLHADVVKNYTFLTNQITLFDANDPDALGGLLPAGEDGEGSPQISFDIGEIFAGYEASVAETRSENGDTVYVLAFVNKDRNANVLDVEATVPASDWLPRKLVFHQKNGTVLAELNAEDLIIDSGLDAADVAYLPDDAEIIDNRKQP